MPGILKDIILYNDPNSQTAEAVRCLRTNIQFLNIEGKTKVIAFTSGLPQEGKTFLTANLAVATAQSNKKTLLVDCDIRRGGITRLFGLNLKEGLSTFLANKGLSLKELPLYDVGVDNLTILPSGSPPANPAELLESEAMNNIISMGRDKFDIVYIDTPPVLSVADPIIICKKADGVVFVAMANVSLTKLVKRSCATLKKSGVNIIGTVLNRVDMGASGYYRYKYKYYYGK